MRLLAASLPAALAIAGCGGGSSNDPAQIRGTLAELTRAAATKDYATLCSRVLAPQLVQQITAINLPCQVALARGLGGVVAPRLQVLSMQIKGRAALVKVHTSASNQGSSTDTVELEKVGSRWYVLSLVSPAAAPAATK